ncbi:MAG: vWA domain-containing protein [Candidatus Cryptobacteroides sp.]
MDYKVDIVMCIDITGSMQDCIDTVKSRALQFWPDLQEALQKAAKNVSDVRVKVIAFRDFEADGDQALVESRYFNLSAQGSSDPEEYKAFVSGLVADGGGDEPENSLEALAMAINSDWVQTGDRRRHVIVMFTDASAHKLEDANTSNPNYPQNMPHSLEELSELWMTPSGGQQGSKTKLKQPAKRLIVFAPQVYPWPEIYESWDQFVYNPSKAGQGLDDVSYEDIINSIVASV